MKKEYRIGNFSNFMIPVLSGMFVTTILVGLLEYNHQHNFGRYETKIYYSETLPAHLNAKIYARLPGVRNLGFSQALPVAENTLTQAQENLLFADFFLRDEELFLNLVLHDRHAKHGISEVMIDAVEISGAPGLLTDSAEATKKIITQTGFGRSEVIINRYFKAMPDLVRRIINNPEVELKITTNRGYITSNLAATCDKHARYHSHAPYHHDHSEFANHTTAHIYDEHIKPAEPARRTLCDKLKHAQARQLFDAGGKF